MVRPAIKEKTANVNFVVHSFRQTWEVCSASIKELKRTVFGRSNLEPKQLLHYKYQQKQRILTLTTLAITTGFCMSLWGSKANAEWDLKHAGAVEDLLGSYIKTLPEGHSIELPRLFIYQGTAFSRACPGVGIDSPAYCSGDHTVYLEITLANAVNEKFGDFGALSIIAHEFGHAYMVKTNKHPPGKEGELAADAFAGGFARYANSKGLLESGDLEEARSTFEAVGDYEIFHHDHHGTPMERGNAFDEGYLKGFRLPGDRKTKAIEPTRTHSTNTEAPPAEAKNSSTGVPLTPALPLLGLGIGGLLMVIVVAAIVLMVNKAGEDDI